MASDGARPQVQRLDHRVAPPPGRALNHRRHRNRNHSTPASFSSVSVSVHGGAGSLSSPSSTSASSSLDHKPLLAPTPFILDKCIRTDDDAFAKDDDVSVGPAVGSLVIAISDKAEIFSMCCF
ncbi:hypothetical protein Ahy_B09g095474 [Arachis hypogaea]|uniref:Uncharacterized protein n=1 Tax=Arachis hypogaea TaxID=3818 RepID=A0A444XEA1_ARAHY|nr:hypothetical protein Ahy_B09g095474 [Arachis hypogaea]